MRSQTRRVGLACAALLGIAGLGLLAGDAWIAAKAGVAEILIRDAFAAHLRDGAPHTPWPWADTHPVARLDVPRLGVRRFVLQGATGSSLAFGPGHVDGTALPNESGNCVIAGHRDSWFAFLEQLRPGDRIELATPGATLTYRIDDLSVAEADDSAVLAPGGTDRLTLVTCWPFRQLRRSSRRFVVSCTRE